MVDITDEEPSSRDRAEPRDSVQESPVKVTSPVKSPVNVMSPVKSEKVVHSDSNNQLSSPGTHAKETSANTNDSATKASKPNVPQKTVIKVESPRSPVGHVKEDSGIQSSGEKADTDSVSSTSTSSLSHNSSDLDTSPRPMKRKHYSPVIVSKFRHVSEEKENPGAEYVNSPHGQGPYSYGEWAARSHSSGNGVGRDHVEYMNVRGVRRTDVPPHTASNGADMDNGVGRDGGRREGGASVENGRGMEDSWGHREPGSFLRHTSPLHIDLSKY